MARQSQASPFAAVYGIVAANWSLSGADCTDFYSIWGWVKTLVPSEPQNSW